MAALFQPGAKGISSAGGQLSGSLNSSGVNMGNSIGLNGQQATPANATLQASAEANSWMFPEITGPNDHGTLQGPSAAQQTGWTGVSTAADPYGIANIGGQSLSPGGSFAGFNGAQLLAMSQPQVAPPPTTQGAEASGYATPVPTPDQNTSNPYAAQGTTDASAIAANTASAQNNINSAQSAQSSYPAFPNSYGLGGSTAAAPAAASAPQGAYSSGAVTVNVPDTSSRGFSPWSMVGESNSRDSSKGVVTSTTPTGI